LLDILMSLKIPSSQDISLKTNIICRIILRQWVCQWFKTKKEYEFLRLQNK
jgi:hypothetical protein